MEYSLNDTWTLYLHYKDLGTNYNENLEKLMEIDNIQTFWQTYNNIPSILDLFSDGVNIKKIKRNNSTPCAYSIFKNGISPCWEHPDNKSGFEFSIKTTYNFNKMQSDWLNSMICVIGNKGNAYECINGVRVVDCTKYNSVVYRLEFWVNDLSKKDEVENLLRSNDFEFKKVKFMFRTHDNVKETV